MYSRTSYCIQIQEVLFSVDGQFDNLANDPAYYWFEPPDGEIKDDLVAGCLLPDFIRNLRVFHKALHPKTKLGEKFRPEHREINSS